MKRIHPLLAFACSFFVLSNSATNACAQTQPASQPQPKEHVTFVLPPNTPKGVARGIHPGRVAWAHAPGTATWDGTTGYWFEDRWNNQANCDWMIRQTLTALTGERNEKKAWDALFVYFNRNHGKGNASYKKGEKIAVKINLNNSYTYEDSEGLNTSPHLVLSLLRSLVGQAGVAQEDISVLEPSRLIPDFLFNKWHAEFPRIRYVDNAGEHGRTKATYIEDLLQYSIDNGAMAKGIETLIAESDYNINMALLKGHSGHGVTLCAKNWFGATSIPIDSKKTVRNNFNQNRDGSPCYLTFVDFMGHKDLGEKTLVSFIDALYGSEKVGGKPSGKWRMAPFFNNWPNSLFASQDQVAIDAVGTDFLCAEFPGMPDTDYCDSSLLEAALAGNAPSGTVYDPEKDGVPCTSLGVVEHWNNARDMQYSRNLGKNEGIELIKVMQRDNYQH